MEFRLETLSGGKDGWMFFCMNSRIGAWVGRYIHARMDGGYEKVDGWIDEWERGQVNGSVGYGCTDELAMLSCLLRRRWSCRQ